MLQFGGEDISCWSLLGITFLTLLVGVIIGFMMGTNNLIIAPVLFESEASEGFTNNKTKVMLYTWTTCGACKQFMSSNVWPQLDGKVSGVMFDHYETSNPSQDSNIPSDVQYFPTIRLIKTNGSHVDHSGPRTVEGLVAWINANK